jgi:predicted permease
MPLLQDFRYAVRTLRKAPLFTSVAIFSLALGIGANTAIFTLVNQIILRLLPVRHPEELVLLTARGRHYGSNNGGNALSYPMYQDFRDKNQVFSGVFCKYAMDFSLTVDGRTEMTAGELVSGNYFPVLGVGAALGRVFTASDDLYQGQHPLAVLSYGFWKTRFNGDPGVLGKRIVVNGYPLTIVGVSRAGFDGVEAGVSPQIRVPMMMKHQLTNGSWYTLNDRRSRFVQAFGRLKPGISLEAAKGGLQPLFHQILNMEVQEKAFARATPYTKQEFLKMWMDVLPASKGRSSLRRQFANPLLALMAIVGLVLLIACSNVANLLIARATARQKEIAIRLAMGASRRKLIVQLLEESLLLSCAGGLAGLGLAVVMDKTLLSFLPADTIPTTVAGAPDTRVLLFTLAVSVLTGLIFGLVPAIQATRPNLAGTLKDQAGSVVGGTSVGLRKGLVVAQVALSLLLLIGAGLFVQSLKNLRNVNPGFQTESLVTFFVDPALNGYKPERSREFYRQLSDRLAGIPGGKGAGMAVMALLTGNEWDSSVAVEGYTAKQGENVGPHMNFVSTGFFDALGIRVLAGRVFDLRDEQANSAPVGIINETFAKRYFAGSNPVGRHVGMGGDPGTKLDIEIIGVVKDTKYEDMRSEVPYELYRPYRQMNFTLGMNVYVRAHGDPSGLFPVLREAVRETDANVPVVGMRTLDQQVDRSLATERMLATLSAVFGLLATVLAAVGLYGVMAYMVARRTREIGIRMALGAGRTTVVWLVMREVLTLVGIGIVIGAPAAWLLSRLVESQLFGVKPADPATMALAMIGIAVVAGLSGYLPARRATGIDPMRALRWE